MRGRSTSRRSTIAARRSTSSSISRATRRARSGIAMLADPGRRAVLGQIPSDLAQICRALTKVVADPRGSALIDDLRATAGGPTIELVWQALFADCLRVVHGAVIADGVIEDDEINALYEIIAAAAQHYAAGLRSQYGEFAVVDGESARAFL